MMYRGGLIWLVLVLISARCCYGRSRLEEWEVTLHHGIEDDNGQPLLDPPYHSAGYLNLSSTHAARLFYYYAQDRNRDPNQDAPLVFWTNGGPGASAMDGAFGLYGAFDITDHLKLKYNDWGWDRGQHVIFVDQPVGVGFSYSTDPRDAVHWEEKVGDDMLTFFLEFMELHPELKDRELFLSGISYAGHYVPSIAAAIQKSNKEGKNMYLNLKGILLGNPSIHASYEYYYMPSYAYQNNLLTQAQILALNDAMVKCWKRGVKCNEKPALDNTKYNVCGKALVYCVKKIQKKILKANPGLDPYDIRINRGPKQFESNEDEEKSSVEKYLNLPEVQKQLGVHKQWISSNDTVFRNMLGDSMRDMTPKIVDLLNNGIRVHVFSGDKDMICHWLGTKNILDDMVWDKSQDWKGEFKEWNFVTRGTLGWRRQVHKLGACETLEPLTNCKIYDSGHTVGPVIAYLIMRTFVTGGSFVGSDPSFTSTRAIDRQYYSDKRIFPTI